jgi:hypothetical protein
MKNSPIRTTLVSSVLIASAACAVNTRADNLAGSDEFLCAVLDVTQCVDVEGCKEALHEDLNIPQFLRVNTGARSIGTTAASGQNRETRAQTVTRSEGRIVFQGVETGRAFSLYIEEATGLATFASVSDGRIVTVFAACTPDTDS